MGRTVTERTNGWGVDSSDLRGLLMALRKAQPQVTTDLREELRLGGLVVADEAKRIVSGHSRSVAATIRVSSRGATVAVLAGNAETPLAGLLELGNDGGGRSASAARAGRFRHPVFGDEGDWVSQDMHPYLLPALKRKMPEVESKALHAVDKAVQTIAFDYKA